MEENTPLYYEAILSDHVKDTFQYVCGPDFIRKFDDLSRLAYEETQKARYDELYRNSQTSEQRRSKLYAIKGGKNG